MKVEFINPFIESVIHVCSSMLNCQVSMGNPEIAKESEGTPHIIGVIGLSGTADGIVALKLPVPTALEFVGQMAGMKFKSVDSSIIDGIGELVSIIAGNAKANFGGHRIMLSLPTVVRGNIYNHEKAVFLSVPFESKLGNFSLLVTFKPTETIQKEKENVCVGSR